MADGSVLIEITADASKYDAAVANLNESTRKQASLISDNMKSAGVALTAGITAPLLALGVASVKSAIDYESAMASVRKTTDLTDEQLKELGEGAKRMSEQKMVSASQILELEALGGQLGIAEENLEEFAATVADLDVATDMNADDAAMQLAQFANITKMSQQELDNMGSAIVALGNNSATTESNIMAMGMRIAGAGSQIGMTESDILALSASLASVGISAEAGGTAISTTMSQIDKDVALGSDTLEVWADVAGMSAAEFSTVWKNEPVVAMQAIMSGMDAASTSGGNLNLILDELGIGAIRQTDVLKRMSNASDMLGTSVALSSTAWADNTALQDEAAARYMTTESQMAMLQNKLTNIASEIGGPLLGALNGLITASQPILDIVGAMASGFAEMPAPLQSIVIGLMGTVALVGPVAGAYGKITESASNFIAKSKELTVVKRGEEKATTAARLEAEIAAAKASANSAKEEIAASKLAVAKQQERLARMEATGSIDSEKAAKSNAIIQSELENIQEQEIIQAKAEEVIARGGVTTATGAETAATGAGTVAKGAFAGVTGIATAAVRTFSAALASNPIGLVIAGVATLAPLIMGLGSAIAGATTPTRESVKAVNESVAGYEEWKKQLDEGGDKAALYGNGLNNLKVAEENLANAEKELTETGTHVVQLLNEDLEVTEELTVVDEELRKARDDAAEVVENYTTDLAWLNTELQANAKKEATARDLVKEHGTNADYAAMDLASMGITLEDVNAILGEEIATVAAANVELDNLRQSNQFLNQALANTGMTTEQFSEHLKNAGMDVKDFERLLPNAAETLEGSFERMAYATVKNTETMEDELKYSLADMQGNLSANAAYMDNYADNLEFLLANAGTDGQRQMIMSLKDMDPSEGASIAAQLVASIQAGDGAFEALGASFESSMMAQTKLAMVGVSQQMATEAPAAMEPAAEATAEAFVDETTDAVVEAAPAIAEAAGPIGLETASAVAKSFEENVGIITEAVNSVMSQVAEAIAAYDFSASATPTIGTLAAGLFAGTPVATGAMTTLLIAIDGIISAKSFHAPGRAKATEFGAGLGSGAPYVRLDAEVVGQGALDALIEAAAAALAVGMSMDAGMARGIDSGAWMVDEAARRVAKSALESAKREADVRSPAHKWEDELGEMMGLGAALGLEQTESDMEAAARHFMQVAQHSAERGLEGFSALIGTDGFSLMGALPDLTRSIEVKGALGAIAQAPSTSSTVYSIGDLSYTPDSRIAKLMQELFAEVNRVQRMGRLSYG